MNVFGGLNISSSQQPQMSSDQVQNEIQAIDSILKALNTGGYSMSSMDTLSQLTGGTNDMVHTHAHTHTHTHIYMYMCICYFIVVT